MQLNKKTTTLLLIAVIGFLLMYFTISIYPKTVPPSGHLAVAQQVSVYDATNKRYQNLYFVRSGETRGLTIKTLAAWTPEKSYPYSIWEFRTGDDVNAVMIVGGPADDGSTYGVEVARLMCNEMRVDYPMGTTSFPQGSNSGYCWFEIQL